MQQGLRDGTVSSAASELPNFLWKNERCDPNRVLFGFLQGELLVKVRYIYPVWSLTVLLMRIFSVFLISYLALQQRTWEGIADQQERVTLLFTVSLMCQHL